MQLDDLAQVSAFGFTLVTMLYYLNQTAKRAGYVASRDMLKVTLGEAALLVGLYHWRRPLFNMVVVALGLAVAVTMYHAAIKDKAKDNTNA